MAFWAAVSLLAILALHAIRQHPRRLPTTTLYIWRKLAEESSVTLRLGKLVINVPLVLQLLLAALLVLALAGPLWISEVAVEKDVVLVVDASASMNTMEPGGTRFEQAREVALAQVAAIGPGQRMAVVAMGRTPRLVQPFTGDVKRLRAAVAGLAPTDASASLQRTLRFALSLAEDLKRRQVVLIGDGAYHDPDGSVALLNERVRFVPVGGAGENVGIVQFAYRTQVPPHEGGELLVTLRNFAAEARGVTFSAELAGAEMVRHSFQVEPGTPYSLVIPVQPGSAGVAEATLEPRDDLPTDNRAYATVSRAPPVDVLLVGTADPPLNAALLAIPDVRVTQRTGAGANGGTPYGDYDLLLFNRVEPPHLEQGTLVVIGEASPQGGVRAEGWVDEHRVTGWRGGDALLRWVDPRQLWVSKARRLVPELDTEVLVSGAAGALVTRRVAGGLRVVTLAFDLREPGFATQETFPLLMSNLVDWARQSEGWAPERRVRPGDVYTWWPGAAGGGLRVTGPGGRFWSFPAGTDPVRFKEADRVGVYTFESEGRVDRLAVNLLDPGESRIERNPAAVGALLAGGRAGTGELAHAGWPWLVLLGAAILLIEWLIWIRDN